jgi:hypothetical protein
MYALVAEAYVGKCLRQLLNSSVSPANLHSTNFSTITITYQPGLVQ